MQSNDVISHSIFSKSDKLIIIGFPKCGTSSLVHYLENKFPNTEVKKIETMIYDEHGVEEFKRAFPDFTPIIITREPADRLWSGFYYYQLNKKMEFEDFLKRTASNLNHAGLGEPIKQSIYEDYTKVWRDLNPIHVTLEDISQLEDFPHLLKTDNKDKFPMPAFYRNLVEKSIQFLIDKRDRLEAIERGDIIPNIHGDVIGQEKVKEITVSNKQAKDDDGKKFNAENYSYT